MRMRRRTAGGSLAVLGVLVLGAPAGAHRRDEVRTVTVNCAAGRTIGQALGDGDRDADDTGALVIVVRGTCHENVTITRDDVTLQGEPGAAVVGADGVSSTIVVDGGHRVAITGLTVAGGGRHGVSAFRGATVDLSGCVLENNAQLGLVASFGSIVIADGCLIQNNGTPPAPPVPALGGGAVASNGGQLVLTNSTVQNNFGSGVTATRTSSVRLGQDFLGSPTVGPVTISGNTGSGVVVTDASSGMVVGGTITGSGSNGVVVSNSSTAQIGVGQNGVTAGVTITNSGTGPGALSHGITVYQGSRALIAGTVVDTATGDGIRVEGAAITVTTSTVRNGGRYGIEISNGGSARLGLNDNGSPSSNLIELNTLDGVHLVDGGSAWFFGNTIQNNGAATNRWGVLVMEKSVARFVGRNTVQNNGGTGGGGGIVLRDGSLHVQRGDFTIGPNTNAILNNSGDGIQAVEHSTVDLRDGASVTGNTAHGIFLLHGSRLQAQNATIDGGAAPALELTAGSTALFGPTPVTITGPVVCNDGESSVAGIPLPPGCTGF